MKLKKFIMNYWGDIFFLLSYPLIPMPFVRHWRTLGIRYVSETFVLCLVIAHIIFTVFAFIWVLFAFKNKHKLALRHLQYPLYCLLAAAYMLVYVLYTDSLFLFDSAERIFLAIALARFGFWFNERRGAKKAGSTPDQSPKETP